MRFLPLILKNAWRNRRRTTLTVVSIGISMCLLGMLMAIYHAFYLADPPPGPGAAAGDAPSRFADLPHARGLRGPYPPHPGCARGGDPRLVRRRV